MNRTVTDLVPVVLSAVNLLQETMGVGVGVGLGVGVGFGVGVGLGSGLLGAGT